VLGSVASITFKLYAQQLVKQATSVLEAFITTLGSSFLNALSLISNGVSIIFEIFAFVSIYPWRPLTDDIPDVIRDNTKVGSWVDINWIFAGAAIFGEILSVVATVAMCFVSQGAVQLFPALLNSSVIIEVVRVFIFFVLCSLSPL
jgi:hypothetical protein